LLDQWARETGFLLHARAESERRVAQRRPHRPPSRRSTP
jgi:hypothetical protein